MDGQYDAVREYIASQAHLLGAIRLPKGTFAGIASTEVQTDILVLRKRQRAEAVEAKWLELGTVPDSLRHPQCYEALPADQRAWYAEHPQFCIGRIRRESNGYEEGTGNARVRGRPGGGPGRGASPCCLPVLIGRWRTRQPRCE